MSKLNVSLIQLNATENKDENLKNALDWTQKAISKKADFILLPEMFNYRSQSDTPSRSSEPLDGPSLMPFYDLAKKYNIHILAGSIAEMAENSSKSYNTSVLINPNGEIAAIYRKIHLFDADLTDTSIRESNAYEPGQEGCATAINNFSCGLSICYDVRFPYLYTQYAENGVDILTVPSSFTAPTGKAHWEILLRARAIENQSYVLAPNQVGIGTRGVPTFGHSMIVDPWGSVLAVLEESEGLVSATLDKEEILKVRAKIPMNRKRLQF